MHLCVSPFEVNMRTAEILVLKLLSLIDTVKSKINVGHVKHVKHLFLMYDYIDIIQECKNGIGKVDIDQYIYSDVYNGEIRSKDYSKNLFELIKIDTFYRLTNTISLFSKKARNYTSKSVDVMMEQISDLVYDIIELYSHFNIYEIPFIRISNNHINNFNIYKYNVENIGDKWLFDIISDDKNKYVVIDNDSTNVEVSIDEKDVTEGNIIKLTVVHSYNLLHLIINKNVPYFVKNRIVYWFDDKLYIMNANSI